jgi:hypothetical protein
MGRDAFVLGPRTNPVNPNGPLIVDFVADSADQVLLTTQESLLGCSLRGPWRSRSMVLGKVKSWLITLSGCQAEGENIRRDNLAQIPMIGRWNFNMRHSPGRGIVATRMRRSCSAMASRSRLSVSASATLARTSRSSCTRTASRPTGKPPREYGTQRSRRSSQRIACVRRAESWDSLENWLETSEHRSRDGTRPATSSLRKSRMDVSTTT